MKYIRSDITKLIIVVTSAVILSACNKITTTDQSSPTVGVEQNQESVSTTSESESEALSTNGRYVEYSPTALVDATGTRRVLFFYAAWCPTCKPADADFKANSDQIPEDVTVIRVNYNDDDTDEAEKALAKKYAVTYQHTYVEIDSEGNTVKVWNGGQLDELLENVE